MKKLLCYICLFVYKTWWIIEDIIMLFDKNYSINKYGIFWNKYKGSNNKAKVLNRLAFIKPLNKHKWTLDKYIRSILINYYLQK